MQDKISLAGDLGSGKSTAAHIVIDELGMEYYSTGNIFRGLAEKYGVDVKTVNKMAETDPVIDKEVDDGLVALSRDPRALLIDSRMAWHFVKGTFKIYLTVELMVAASRIHAANRAVEHFESVEATAENMKERRASENKRYFEKYGVQSEDHTNYDLVLDTTYITPGQVADCMVESFHAWQADKTAKFCYMSPLRLRYPADMPDGVMEQASQIAEAIEAGTRPPVKIAHDGENFCVVSDPATALAYSLTDLPLIPCTLTKELPTGDFVAMKDNL